MHNTRRVNVNYFLESKNASEPRVAYNGTSAAFDIAASEYTVIPAGTDVEVPTDIRVSIDEKDPFYMQIHPRSSYGFVKGMQVHIGIIDAGYTGPLSIKVFNRTDKDIIIDKGDYFAQVLVIEKPTISLNKMSHDEFQTFQESQLRGSGGFGSSGK